MAKYIVTLELQTNGESGVTEEVEVDAAAVFLTEHWLYFGTNSTRDTADTVVAAFPSPRVLSVVKQPAEERT